MASIGKVLKRIEFGNPILREITNPITADEINSKRIQQLITDMMYTLHKEKLGVGLAAPQVGKSIALAIISIRQLKHRKKVKPFDAVLINPEIIETFGRRIQLYEGCISGGPGKAALFAKVPRYKKVKVKYLDEKGKTHQKVFENLKAQIIQHEIDHLNGILYVDRVKDTKSYMTYSEYIKHMKKQD